MWSRTISILRPPAAHRTVSGDEISHIKIWILFRANHCSSCFYFHALTALPCLFVVCWDVGAYSQPTNIQPLHFSPMYISRMRRSENNEIHALFSLMQLEKQGSVQPTAIGPHLAGRAVFPA